MKKVENLNTIFHELHSSHTRKNKKTGDFSIEESLDTNNPLVVKGLSAIILQGVKYGASDIHLEPMESKTRIRYRIDGILYEKSNFDISLHNALISRLKIISKLDITEHRTPQDGKFRDNVNGKNIDFRVSIIPLVNGEKAVIRILDQDIVNFNLEDLGFTSEEYKIIDKLIHKKNGVILSSGPTGSGKTSLLYAILKKLNNSEVNISTIEDPIEYQISGINQVQYDSERLNFSTALKSYLRQDPDILMIGEIRDSETAQIALKSALTGHLVLSTIHTTDAVSGIFRLRNIGVENYMISAGVSCIIAQRLVRRLCPNCKKIDSNWKEKIEFLGLEPENYQNEKFYTSTGCEKCNNTGYLGRLPVFQILIIDKEIRDLIDCKKSYQEILNYIKKIGVKSLAETGIDKAKLGLTSIEEIIRQC